MYVKQRTLRRGVDKISRKKGGRNKNEKKRRMKVNKRERKKCITSRISIK